MAEDLFRHTRPFNQLDGFYTDWSRHVTKDCLPPLRDFPTDAKNDAVLGDIRSYYDTLNHYANKDTILYLLFPSWRSNSLETSIIFLGDIDPHLFTSLIQSFIHNYELNQDPIRTFSNLAEPWEALSSELGNTINDTASRLQRETKEAQDGFLRSFSDKWVSSFLGYQSGTVLMETVTSVTREENGGGAAIMEEFARIFREANQLRKNTINNIAEVLNMNQKALFLESVCKVLAGFKYQDKAFENSLLGYNLIDQQLPPDDEHLFNPLDPSGEVNAHHNYPLPMMPQYASQLPPNAYQLFPPFAQSGLVIAPQNNYPHRMQQFAPLLPVPPYGHQLLPPFPPSGLVMTNQGFRPRMMQPLQRPPPPMNQHHQQQPPGQDHVIYVGNLAPESTDDLLLQRFSHYRSVGVAKVIFDDRTGATYGFVSFADEREKRHAMDAMNFQIFLDRPMHIGRAAKNTI